MPAWLSHDLSAIKNNAAAFLKWLLFACLIGGIMGVVGSGFHYAIDWGTGLRQAHRWLVWLLPVAGLVFSISYLVGDSYNPFLYLQF